MFMLQEVDESGAEGFTVLLPSGTPLPARRHYILSGEGKLSSISLDIYKRFVMQEPERLAKVQKRSSIHPPSPAYLSPGRGGSTFSNDTEPCLSLDTSSISSSGTPRLSQASRET